MCVVGTSRVVAGCLQDVLHWSACVVLRESFGQEHLFRQHKRMGECALERDPLLTIDLLGVLWDLSLTE